MRTGKIKIGDKEYLGCFSTRVLANVEDYTGMSFETGLKDILEKKSIKDIIWFVSQLINAGDRYAKMEGIDNPGTLDEDEIYDIVGVDDYEDVFGSIGEIVKAGTKPEIELKPAKNAKTTQEK